MNWTPIIDDLRGSGLTLEQIGAACDLPKSQIHHMQRGNVLTTTYERGCKLIDLHRRVMRRRARSQNHRIERTP